MHDTWPAPARRGARRPGVLAPRSLTEHYLTPSALTAASHVIDCFIAVWFGKLDAVHYQAVNARAIQRHGTQHD